jgi:hypothetical protein
MKTKKITVELTEEEVSVLEDALFTEMSKSFLTKTSRVRRSLWRKIATQFDNDEPIKG